MIKRFSRSGNWNRSCWNEIFRIKVEFWSQITEIRSSLSDWYFIFFRSFSEEKMKVFCFCFITSNDGFENKKCGNLGFRSEPYVYFKKCQKNMPLLGLKPKEISPKIQKPTTNTRGSCKIRPFYGILYDSVGKMLITTNFMSVHLSSIRLRSWIPIGSDCRIQYRIWSDPAIGLINLVPWPSQKACP
jgi:hypothetical protein